MNTLSSRVPALQTWWILALIISFVGSFGFFSQFPIFSWTVGFSICIASLRNTIKFPPLAAIMFFNLLFFAYAVPFIFLDLDLMDLSSGVAKIYLSHALWLNSLFISAMMLESSRTLKSSIYSFAEVAALLRTPQSTALFFLCLFCILIVTFVLLKGAIVVGSDSGYADYIDNLDANSGVAEYSLIIVFVSFLFVRNRMQRLIWRIVVLAFIIKLALIGFRVVALMATLALFYSFDFKPKAKLLGAFFVLGFFLFSLLGILKEGQQSVDEIFSSLLFAMHGDNAVSHHINVLWASAKLILLVDIGEIDAYRRIYFLFYLLVNSLIPAGLIVELSGVPYLGTWLQQSGNSSGGGHISSFLFVAGGPILVLTFGYLFGLFFRIALSNRHGLVVNFVRAFFLMTLLTFPRWISYDIGNFLLKLPNYAAFLIVFIGLLSRRSPHL